MKVNGVQNKTKWNNNNNNIFIGVLFGDPPKNAELSFCVKFPFKKTYS